MDETPELQQRQEVALLREKPEATVTSKYAFSHRTFNLIWNYLSVTRTEENKQARSETPASEGAGVSTVLGLIFTHRDFEQSAQRTKNCVILYHLKCR